MKETFCEQCQGMVNGNGCGGFYLDPRGVRTDDAKQAVSTVTCPVSGRTPKMLAQPADAMHQ